MATSNAARVVEILQAKGYQAEALQDGSAVCVMDPIACSRGARSWVEYERRKVHVTPDLREVFRFLGERG